MNTPTPLLRCELCGMGLARTANVEAHTRTQLCVATRHSSALTAEGFVVEPDDARVRFLLVASIPGSARWAPTSLLPAAVVGNLSVGPYSQRWWPAWAVELTMAFSVANPRQQVRYPEKLRGLAAAPEAMRKSVLTTLRVAGVEAADALLFRRATDWEAPHE